MGLKSEFSKISAGLMHGDSNELHLHAFEATLLVANTVFWSLTLAVVFRMPEAGLIWLLGPLLSTVGAFCEKTRADRAKAIAINLFQFGTLQFVFAMLEPHYVVIALLVPLAVALTARRRYGNNAGAVMVAGLMNYEHGTFLEGLDIFLILICLILLVVPTYVLWDRLLFGKRPWGGSTAVPPLTRQAVWRRSAAFAAALLLYDAVDWTHGFWIPLTVGLAYSGGSAGRVVREVARKRLLWAPVGFGLAVLWLSALGFIDYQFNYLAAAWAFVAFYYCFRADDYVGFYLLFMVMISGANNLVHSTSPDFGNGWILWCQSIAAVALGAAIVSFAEWVPEEPEAAAPEKT